MRCITAAREHQHPLHKYLPRLASSSFCFPLLCISLLIGVTLFLRSRHHEKVKVTLADNMTIWEDVMMTEWKIMVIFSNWWVFLISMSEVYWSFAKHTLLMTPKMLICQWEINKHRHACAYTYTHTHTVCKNPKRKVWYDMIWYDMIWYDMIWYDMIWNDMIWYDMIWYDMIWYDMIWYDMIWYDMIWYEMIWYDMIWYDMIWYDMIWCDMI